MAKVNIVTKPSTNYEGFVESFFQKAGRNIGANDLTEAMREKVRRDLLAKAGGRALGGALPRLIPGVGVVLSIGITAYELYNLYEIYKLYNAGAVWPVNNGWYVRATYHTPPPGVYWGTQNRAYNKNAAPNGSSLSLGDGAPAPTPGYEIGQGPPTVATDGYVWGEVGRIPTFAGQFNRWFVPRVYLGRASAVVGPTPRWFPDWQPAFAMPNPNMPQPKFNAPPEPEAPPMREAAGVPELSQTIQPGRGVSTSPVNAGWPGPPARGEKERKLRSLGRTLFAILDNVSETAEVISAIYDALPKDVRKRWDRKGRGLIDQAGQYGIDGADWKIVAIYENYDRVDLIAAMQNIAVNQIEDKVIGEIMRRLPKQAGSAVTGGAFDAYGDLSQWIVSR